MTSSNGNIFRITGALWEEFPPQKTSNAGFDIFFCVRLINFKQTVEFFGVGGLRCQDAHCDVTVM